MPPARLERRSWTLLALLLVALVLLSVHRLVCAAPPLSIQELAGRTMGTTWSVKVVAARLGREQRTQLAAALEEVLAHVNRLMSTWDETSELARFNRHRSREPFPISEPTLHVFRVAREVSERSGGAFDVTVGPLVDAWGFGAAGPRSVAPDPVVLEAARQRVGYQRLVIDAPRSQLSKRHPDLVADLSAVAKGYAVDQLAGTLQARGYHDFLVEVGGELRASGVRDDGGGWRVGIEAPDPGTRAVLRVVELRDQAMATSGDYRNFAELGDERVSHLIDPRSGRPIAHALAAVTVLHDEAVFADAWATALAVLGSEQGAALAEREGLAALFLIRQPDGGIVEQQSRAFGERVDTPPRAGAASG